MTFHPIPCRPGDRSRVFRSLARRALAGVAMAVGLGATNASAQTPVDRVNAPYLAIPEANRSDLILLPALADMEPAPVGAQAPPARHQRSRGGPPLSRPRAKARPPGRAAAASPGDGRWHQEPLRTR